MTARRLERRPAHRVRVLLSAPRVPRAPRSVRVYALFWPLLAGNTALQVAAVVVGRPGWYPWLQVPVTLVMAVLAVRFLVLRVPEVRARSVAGDRPQGRADGVQDVQ